MTHTTPTPTRALHRLAWGLCAAILVATVAAALWLLREQPAGNVVQAIADLTQAIVLAVFGVTGALILSHQPRHTVGRLMMLEGALVYFGSVVLLQRLVSVLTGIEQSPLAVVVSTLAIAALFTPLRRRIQDAVDRRFYRRKYDAQQVLAQFAVTARDETDLDTLTGEMARGAGNDAAGERAGPAGLAL